MANNDLPEKVLENVDGSRRTFVRKMISGPFVVPLITSFAMTGLSAQDANAQVPNSVPTLGPMARMLLPGALLAAGLYKLRSWFGGGRDDDKDGSGD